MVVHPLQTGTISPCKVKVRPILPVKNKAIEGENNWRELEELGITVTIHPRDSNEWTSALLLAPKPDISFRACGDYRVFNNKTIIDGYLLPNLRHFTSKIKGSAIFSRVDLVKAFHQIPLDYESQKKMTVLTPRGA